MKTLFTEDTRRALREAALGGVAKKDQADVADLIDHLKTSTYKGQPGYFVKNNGGTIKDILSRCTIEAPDRRLRWLIGKYADVIAKALGFKSGSYSSGHYRSMKDDPLRTDPHGAGRTVSPGLYFE